MKIVTKSTADKILINSLFVPVNGRTLSRTKFCNGKYRADKSFIGQDVADLPGVHAVYAVKQRDSDGPYTRLMCITEA